MIFERDKLEMCEIELRRGSVRPFVRRQMVDTIDSLLCGGEVGVDLQAVHVADDQQWWVALVRPDAIRVVHSHQFVSRVVLHIRCTCGPRLTVL